MSPLVTRPSLPEPGTVEASTPLSAESLRTDGASDASGGGAFSAAGTHAAAGAGSRSGRGSGRFGGTGRAVGDLAEQRADQDRIAVLRRNLAEHAGGRRR